MNQELLLLLSNAITAVAAWFVGKRRTNAETDNLILQGLEHSISIYRDIIEDLRKEIESLNTKVSTLESKIEELIKENHELKGFGKGL